MKSSKNQNWIFFVKIVGGDSNQFFIKLLKIGQRNYP